MPKRNPGTPDLRPVKPPTPVDVTPLLKLKLRLVKLQNSVLPELRIGNLVTLRNLADRISVETPLGSAIGDVANSDVVRLKGRSVVGATIYDLRLDPPTVIIEVLLT